MTIYHFVTKVELSLGQRGHMPAWRGDELCVLQTREPLRGGKVNVAM